MSPKLKVIGLRFLRTFVSGFLSVAGVVTALDKVDTWSSLASALNVIAIAGVIGGVTAVLTSADKWIRWQD